MKKWLKKIIAEALKEVLVDGNYLAKTLSKEDVNIVYVPTGRLPKSKAEEYVKNLSDKFKKAYPEYKILWLAKGD